MSFTVFRYKILEKNTGHWPGDSWKRPALILDIDIAHYVIDEDTIQIFKYSLWDVERSILEMPASWRYLYLEEKGSLPADDEAITWFTYGNCQTKENPQHMPLTKGCYGFDGSIKLYDKYIL